MHSSYEFPGGDKGVSVDGGGVRGGTRESGVGTRACGGVVLRGGGSLRFWREARIQQYLFTVLTNRGFLNMIKLNFRTKLCLNAIELTGVMHAKYTNVQFQ